MIADGAWHRIQFAFTITYHYLFPQLTMGLAWFLVYWKWRRCGPARRSTTRPRGSGQRFSASISASALSPEFPWSFSSEPIGLISPDTPGRSSARRWRWKACSLSFWRALLWRAHLGRKAAGAALSFPGRGRRRHRKLAVRIFHPGDKRFHAASGWLLDQADGSLGIESLARIC